MDAIQNNPMYQLVVSHCMRVHKKVQPLSTLEVVALLDQAYMAGFGNGKIQGYVEIASSCTEISKALKAQLHGTDKKQPPPQMKIVT